ncbi:hypothetical protein BC835DRAFT_1461144 [Cytidiella melzeri]|nr:hypothetical protein BC835DRAFT_1461144 [Cytidiella melzeri]
MWCTNPPTQSRAVNSKAASQSFLLAVVTFALSASVINRSGRCSVSNTLALLPWRISTVPSRIVPAEGERIFQIVPPRRRREKLVRQRAVKREEGVSLSTASCSHTPSTSSVAATRAMACTGNVVYAWAEEDLGSLRASCSAPMTSPDEVRSEGGGCGKERDEATTAEMGGRVVVPEDAVVGRIVESELLRANDEPGRSGRRDRRGVVVAAAHAAAGRGARVVDAAKRGMRRRRQRWAGEWWFWRMLNGCCWCPEVSNVDMCAGRTHRRELRPASPSPSSPPPNPTLLPPNTSPASHSPRCRGGSGGGRSGGGRSGGGRSGGGRSGGGRSGGSRDGGAHT